MNVMILGLHWVFWVVFIGFAGLMWLVSRIPKIDDRTKRKAEAAAILMPVAPFVFALAIWVRDSF